MITCCTCSCTVYVLTRDAVWCAQVVKDQADSGIYTVKRLSHYLKRVVTITKNAGQETRLVHMHPRVLMSALCVCRGFSAVEMNKTTELEMSKKGRVAKDAYVPMSYAACAECLMVQYVRFCDCL